MIRELKEKILNLECKIRIIDIHDENIRFLASQMDYIHRERMKKANTESKQNNQKKFRKGYHAKPYK
jgi:hypothetical protein